MRDRRRERDDSVDAEVAELAARDRKRSEQNNPASISGPEHWYEHLGVRSKQTSLVVDPPNGRVPALKRLAGVFNPERHDAALLTQETVPAVGYDGRGDFSLDPMGLPRRRGESEVVPFLFAGVQLLSHRLFAGESVAPFSMNRLWDKAIAHARIVAIVHDGTWYDVGTVAGLMATESRLGELWFPR